MTKPWQADWRVVGSEVQIRRLGPLVDVARFVREDDAQLAAAAPALVRALLFVAKDRRTGACVACQASQDLDACYPDCPLDAALRQAGAR